METAQLKAELHTLIDQLNDVEALEAMRTFARSQARQEPNADDYRKAAVLNGNKVLAKSLRNHEG